MRILRSALLAAFRYMNTMQFINYNHHAVHYSPRISVPFDHPHPCCLVPTPIPANTNLSLYLWVQFVYLLHSTYKGDCMICFSLSDLLHLAYCFQMFLKMTGFFSFLGWMIFCISLSLNIWIICLPLPRFLYLSIDGHLGYFHVLAIVNNAAVDMGVQYLFKLVFFFPFDKFPEVKFSEHVIVLFLIFEQCPYFL